MRGSYNKLKAKRANERGKMMAAARWKRDRERRDADLPERLIEMAEIEATNLPRKKGDAIGSLQWTDFRTGKVTRWTLRIGDRCDRYTVHSPDGRCSKFSHGLTWFLAKVRKVILCRTDQTRMSICIESAVIPGQTQKHSPASM